MQLVVLPRKRNLLPRSTQLRGQLQLHLLAVEVEMVEMVGVKVEMVGVDRS
jgi:hypothetical protein